jgi:signal transduction histidine kinase
MQDDTPHAALLAHLWDEAALLVLRLDPMGRVTQANTFAQRHLGKECIGRAFHDLLVNFAVPADFDFQACANSPPLVLNFNTPSGQPATYRVGVLATDDGLLAIGSPDIDGLEKLQWQVLKLNGELSNMSRQLHQANAELTRLNALKDRFLGMAAHDLRKPLGAIMAYVDFLRNEAAAALTAEHAGFLATIAQAATRMRGMIDSFLDISVIQSGELRLERAPVTAACIVAGIRPILDVAARTKEVKLTVDLGGSVLMLDVDAGKIEQVLINLVGNAIEHSSPGATVSISVRASGSNAVFAVCDEAGGIPADRLEHLFEPFESAGTHKSGGERSIGLGLAIAHKIVEAHGGRIRVDSQWGRGSTFTVELPIISTTNGGKA